MSLKRYEDEIQSYLDTTKKDLLMLKRCTMSYVHAVKVSCTFKVEDASTHKVSCTFKVEDASTHKVSCTFKVEDASTHKVSCTFKVEDASTHKVSCTFKVIERNKWW